MYANHTPIENLISWLIIFEKWSILVAFDGMIPISSIYPGKGLKPHRKTLDRGQHCKLMEVENRAIALSLWGKMGKYILPYS